MNPYEPPVVPPAGHPVPTAVAAARPVSRTPYVLAAVGAFGASAFWALLTLLIALAAAGGGTSGTSLILPVVLIVLYGYRGAQVLKGDVSAMRSLLWLHGVGGFLAVVQIAGSGGGTFVVVLQGLKIAIHVFGGLTALAAYKQATSAPL